MTDMPFLHQDERAITERAAMRKTAFLREELEQLPAWHPLHREYREALGILEPLLRRWPRSARIEVD